VHSSDGGEEVTTVELEQQVSQATPASPSGLGDSHSTKEQSTPVVVVPPPLVFIVKELLQFPSSCSDAKLPSAHFVQSLSVVALLVHSVVVVVPLFGPVVVIRGLPQSPSSC
jgi:hypothetical protein